jgi:phosphodiesterase/alkaline phosphatase D-like protein
VSRFQHSAHAHGLDTVVLTDDVERWLRWMARALSIVVMAGAVYALVELGSAHGDDYTAWEETASLFALAAAGLGLLLAWLWEPGGASLALVAGVFVGALAAYQYSLLLALGVALLFIVPAALFLLAWHRTQSWLSIIAVATVITVALGAGGAAALSFYNQGHGAAHPASNLGPLPESPVLWIWSGAVTESAAVVTAKVPSNEQVRLAYDRTATFDDAQFVVSDRRGPVHRFVLDGLAPATTYHYAIEIAGRLDTARTGTFETFDEGPQDFTVAFSSCARAGSNGAVFDTIRELQPDLYLIAGDFSYGDVLANSLDAFSHMYDQGLTRPAQARLYASTPIAYTWDDHDYGGNDAASDSPSREAALISYRAHVPHYPLSLPGNDAPIAQAFTIGRVRFILTDTRSARDPSSLPDGPDKTLLGDEQLAWFLDEVTGALADYPLVVWVSSVPWLAEPDSGSDDWGGYTHEREIIASTIAATGNGDRLILLGGDAHMLAIDDGSNNDFAPGGGAAFPVMQAGALDRVGSVKGGPYSEGTYPGGGQFGLITVTDDGGEITVDLRGLTWEAEEVVSLSLTIPETSP